MAGYLLAAFIQIILFSLKSNEGSGNHGANAVLINVIVISFDGICTLAGYLLAVFIKVILTVIIGDQRAGGQFACFIGIEGIADPGICGLLVAYHGIVFIQKEDGNGIVVIVDKAILTIVGSLGN